LANANSALFILNSSPKCSLKTLIFGEPSVLFQSDLSFLLRLLANLITFSSKEKLDETQAGLITLAAKAALEIQKQISKSTQSPATSGGVSGLKKVPETISSSLDSE
jgi:hypothetical protein